MASFNFSVNKNKKDIRNAIKEKVIKNVKGTIYIDKTAQYYVKADNINYDINPKCFSCIGHNTLFRQGEYDKKRVIYVRQNIIVECNPYFWLPFGLGCKVKGDIIISVNNKKVFNITDFYLGIAEDEKDAIDYYNKYLKEINEIIREKRFNGI